MSKNSRNRRLRIVQGAEEPMVEITEDIDLPVGVELTRDHYDPNVYADNTDIHFNAGLTRDRKQAGAFLQRFMKDAKVFVCGRCGGDKHRIFADNQDDQPAILIVCYDTACGATMAPVRLMKLQITDHLLKSAGFWIPPERRS